MSDFITFLIISISGLLLFGFTELMYHRFKIDVEITRKTAHIGSGLLSLLFPVYFHSQWWVLLICAMFQLLLVTSINLGFLKSINAVKRKTYGSVVYPIVVYIVFLFWFYLERNPKENDNNYIYFYLPITILAICDPIATFFGKKYPIYKLKKLSKSIGGSVAFWFTAFSICFFFTLNSKVFGQFDIIWVSILIATVSTFTELYSKKGFDNLFIPISVIISMYLVEYFS
ncbi:MAG: phosphatidate cytidylyltransferase [Bacteroidetes bacterium]|nr:phosphatidate cytidylyltransferase [Bacteroidota bacterium]